MAAILRRKKHINEAGEQPAAQATAPAAATAPASQPAAQPAQAPAPSAPAAAAPTTQPAQSQAQAPAAPQTAQPAAPAQEQQQTPSLKQKVFDFLKSLDEKIQSNDIFWAISFNLPETLQKEVPEFKADNPDAKTALTAWDAFKKAPSKETFDKFTEGLNTFASPATPEQATQQQAQQESFNFSFRDRLMENIEKFKTINRYSRLMENGYKK